MQWIRASDTLTNDRDRPRKCTRDSRIVRRHDTRNCVCIVVAIIVANAIVASRLTNGRASDVKYKFNPGKSIERSARFHLSRSCHSLPGFSLLFSLVCASFRSRRSFARKYARRKTRSKSLSFAKNNLQLSRYYRFEKKCHRRRISTFHDIYERLHR